MDMGILITMTMMFKSQRLMSSHPFPTTIAMRCTFPMGQ
jgi:hypothetical protein